LIDAAAGYSEHSDLDEARIKATERLADEFKAKMADVLEGWQNSHTIAILTDTAAGYSEQSDLDDMCDIRNGR